MSERSPRLRALRPRPQQQQQAKPETSPRRAEVKNKDGKDEEEAPEETSSPRRRRSKDQGSETNSGSEHSPGESVRKSLSKKDVKDVAERDSQEDDKQYECKMCKPPKKYATLKLYMQHLKNEHDNKKPKEIVEAVNKPSLKCPMCSHMASSQQSLEAHHKANHLKRKFFRCVKCNYVTHVRARYTKHVKYHSMPMIKCDTCDFRTPYKWNLDRHTRNHGGGGAFQCQVCNFTADIRQSLTVHETNHHEPPVGTGARKMSPFERRARNTPKRYNQVGASDFREMKAKTNENVTPSNSILPPSSLSIESVTAESETNDKSGADCIALKCEEKGCQFITAWDSEMQRHVSEVHGPEDLTNKPKKKPLPMLIPLSPVNNTLTNNSSPVGSPTTLLKVPRVRLRPELAQIARDNELAKLQASKVAEVKRDLETNNSLTFRPVDAFERKNASFFDKLKERLSTTASNVVPEIALTTINDLKCWCTFEAATSEELSQHKQTHHTALSVSLGISRCPKCRRRCKSSSDLQVHMRLCRSAENSPKSSNENAENAENNSENRAGSFRGEYTFPAQSDWDSSCGDANSFGNSIEGRILAEQGAEERNVEESDEPPKKLRVSNAKNYLQPPELTPAPVATLNSETTNEGPSNVPLRPPPPLKAANRIQGLSLLRKNSDSPNNTSCSISPVPSPSPSSGMEDSKKTLWKCKRCNFRDSSKEVVLQHVKSHYDNSESTGDEKNPFGCGDCPFAAPDSATLAMHRVHHRPNFEAIFKCYLCPYYVTTKAELLEHSRLHGEELAAVHQRNVESEIFPVTARKQMNQHAENASRSSKDEITRERNVMSPSTSTESVASLYKNSEVPSFLLDTRELPDAPLVWVSRPDGTIAKMLKCRHCPYVSQRRAEVHDHETMHANASLPGHHIECPQCSFACIRRDIMESHSDMHKGSLGTVHCLVDDTRPDSQQLSDLATLLGLSKPPSMGAEPDLQDSRLVHCCSKCPARFLCEKELRIHFRYHSTELAYTCQWCSYAARQPAHLMAHQKAHSPEYQERTRYLLSIYGHSQRHPPPTTACIEAGGQNSGDGNSLRVAWIVVEVAATTEQQFANNLANNGPRNGNQVFTCAKCPARYFKLDALEYHMTLHGSNNRFKCIECDYSSKTAQNLVKHQVVHRRHAETANPVSVPRVPPPDPQFGIFMRGNPNFVYPGYLRNGRLKEKRYKCHKCPSAFEKREQYRVHLTLHGAKQRYCCDTCDYSVKYYANYAQHIKKHEANALAQASHRQCEVETIPLENETDEGIFRGRRGKSLKKSSLSNSINNTQNLPHQTSNQDKQSVMMMQRKGIIQAETEPKQELRCMSCPFSSSDKEVMDSHKRRHGIDRLTPSCPHCDYVPRKEENIGDHIRLHFTRIFKPDSYVIVDFLSLSVKKIFEDGKEEEPEILFKECEDGKYLPDLGTFPVSLNNSTNGIQERVIVDPLTGETKFM
ncbi:uncharacterized protein LOC117167474 isoform X2 [Belonocnema kinseyi]|uniref:uncharacterized protein LOC117167474 isoform X2 n=1 Tax=Belonocnema kinseyi TaxID=2817044 RepID=UPI00143D4789|nr:uncharacterized protein LOC117167474 isoform X2 [Belonocnema kinseyi]